MGLLPVGYDAGPVFGEEDDDRPEAWLVRLGEDLVELTDPVSAFLWQQSHVHASDAVIAEAVRQGATDATDLADQLVELGLLLTVDVAGAARSAALREHRLQPQAFGLGNSPTNPEQFAVGYPPMAVQGLLNRLEYAVWADGPVQRDLAALVREPLCDLSSGYDAAETSMLATIRRFVALGISYVDRAANDGSPSQRVGAGT